MEQYQQTTGYLNSRKYYLDTQGSGLRNIFKSPLAKALVIDAYRELENIRKR